MVVFGDERPEAVSRITSFRSDVIRPQEARHGAIFAIMVDLNADYECRGTNFIELVICRGLETLSKPPGAVSRYKHCRTYGSVTV